MKKLLLILCAALPLYAHADFSIQDGALKSKQEAERQAVEQKKAAEKAAAEKAASEKAAVEAAVAIALAKAEAAKKAEPPESVVVEKRGAPIWVLTPSSSLRTVVNDWAKRAGWHVVWQLKDEQTQEDTDFILGGGFREQGPFKDAIRRLFKSIPKSANVKAQFWSENDPPMLYVIKGEEP